MKRRVFAVAVAALLAGCSQETIAANNLGAALGLTPAQVQTVTKFAITDGGAAACSYAQANPPKGAGSVTQNAYNAFLAGCASPPTDLATANTFLTNLAISFITAEVLSE